MAKSRRSYKGAPVSNTLASGGLAQGATTISLATAMSGWPTGSAPFFVVVNPGTANEEKICVIYATTTTLTVVDEEVTSGWSASANGRGCDDTTDRVHAGGATIYPVFTALEANQANLLVSTYANEGGIVYQGASNPTQLAIGTAGQVLKVNSGASAPEWGQVAAAGIATDAVTADKILAGAVGTAELDSGAVTLAKLATAVQNFLVPVGTIAMYGGASAPTGWLLCDGTAINASYTSLIAIVGANTPDLKGRFAIGDNSSLTLLGTGGSATIAEANLPSHTHTFSGNTGGMSANSTPGHTVNDSGHAHTLDVSAASGGALGALYIGDSSGTDSGLVNSATTGISVDSHNIAHTHTYSGTTNGGSGSGTAYYPPYLVVNYIIKHD